MNIADQEPEISYFRLFFVLSFAFITYIVTFRLINRFLPSSLIAF